MDMSELKEDFSRGTPVIYDGITYDCITAIILRRVGWKKVIQAELADRHGNSVTIAQPDKIQPAPAAAEPWKAVLQSTGRLVNRKPNKEKENGA